MNDEVLMDIIQQRRSVRNYQDADPVSRAELERLMEAARWAPSPTNRQLWKFISLTDGALIGKIVVAVEDALKVFVNHHPGAINDVNWEQYFKNFTFFQTAPVVIFVIYRKTIGYLDSLPAPENGEEVLNQQSVLLSVGAAVQNLLLMAHTMGLQACWMTGPLVAKEKIAELLDISFPWSLISMIPLGKGMVTGAGVRKDLRKIWDER